MKENYTNIDIDQNHIAHTDFSIVLDFATLPIIFVTPDFEVNYFNFRAFSFFQAHEKAFKQCDPAFHANALLHTTFDIFSMHLTEHMKEIDQLKLGENLKFFINVDYLQLEIKIMPLFTVSHVKSGLCIEIHDRTELLNTLDLLNVTLENAKEGLFDTTIPLEAVSQEYAILPVLSQKINDLFETIHGFFGEMACAFEDLINGNLTHDLSLNTHEQNNPDSFFSATKRDFNYVLSNLAHFLEKVKNNEQLMQFVLEQTITKNEALASIFKEKTKQTTQITLDLNAFISQTRATHLEVSQAVEVAQTLTNHYSVIDELKNIFQEVGLQLQSILESTRYMHYIFKGHLSNLRTAITEINAGNIGRGIHLINTECEDMIQNTTDMLAKIQISVVNMTKHFDTKHQSLDSILDTLSSNINGMVDIVTLMHTVLNEVQRIFADHECLFDTFSTSLQTLNCLEEHADAHLDQLCILNKTTLKINMQLENIINVFNFIAIENIPLNDQNYVEMKQKHFLLQQNLIIETLN